MGKLDAVSVLTAFELFKTTINQGWVEVGIVGAMDPAVKLRGDGVVLGVGFSHTAQCPLVITPYGFVHIKPLSLEGEGLG
jgi:hypothetical protein